MSDFEREERYIVVKRKHLDRLTENYLRRAIATVGVPIIECVVVERDWPNYEDTWKALGQVASGAYEPGEKERLQTELGAAKAEAERLRSDLETVHNAFGIGNKARSLSVLMVNIENVKRFADYLHAVEQEFFMVPSEPDEDWPGMEPEDVCLLNSWGRSKEDYLQQFEAALLRKQAEAAEDFGNDTAKDWPTSLAEALKQDAKTYAGVLRERADEIENAGGKS